MAYRNRKIQAEPLQSLDIAAATGNYQPINPNGLEHACSILKLTNASNQEVIISYDGENDHDVLTPESYLLLPLQTNSVGDIGNFRKGLVVYAEAEAGGAGNLYLSAYYQEWR